MTQEHEVIGRGNLQRLMNSINEARGLDLSQYRKAYLERRITTRMRAVGVTTYGRYNTYLDDHPEEYTKLLDALTVNVTDFFRDRDVYEKFERLVLPRLLEGKALRRQRMIRVWSAGCSTGEEAYSIAMSLLNVLGDNVDMYLVSVIGTDIDRKALAVAKKGEYSNDKLTHVPRSFQDRFIDPGPGTFRIKPEVASRVRFKPLNLFEDEPMHVMDVIFCRNVFIYFTREQQAHVMERFLKGLQRGGFLVLGRSEKLAPFAVGHLELVDGAKRIYRKP